MDSPLPSSQLPSGWENLPETTIREFLIKLPWQSIPKYCGSSRRVRNICHMGDGIWVEKTLREFGKEPTKIYKDPQFNYLATRANQMQRDLHKSKSGYYTPEQEKELNQISDILIKQLKQNNPSHFKVARLHLSPEEMAPLREQRKTIIHKAGRDPWQDLMIRYSIPSETLVFVQYDPKILAKVEMEEDGFNPELTYAFFSTDLFEEATNISDQGIPDDKDKLHLPFLKSFLNSVGVARWRVNDLFSEEFKIDR